MNSLASATWLMFRTHLASQARTKRALVCVLIAAAPVVIAFLPSRHGEDAFQTVGVLGMLTLQVVAPLIGLLAGSAVVTEEIENRTITFVFTRPVHRASLFLGRWMATLVLISSLLVASALGVAGVATAKYDVDELGRTEHHHDDGEWTQTLVPVDRNLPDGQVARYAWAVVLAGALYSLLTAGLGVFLKRPMILGLGYAFAVEGLLANLPGSSQRLTMQFYLRGILTGIEDVKRAAGDGAVRFWREFPPIADTKFLSPLESSVRLLIVIVLAVAACTWIIRRRQFVLTS